MKPTTDESVKSSDEQTERPAVPGDTLDYADEDSEPFEIEFRSPASVDGE